MTPPDNSTISLSIVVSIVLLIANNLWKTHVASRAASRKEDRALIDEITAAIDSIESDAHLYYSLTHTNPQSLEVAQRLKVTLKKISRCVNRHNLCTRHTNNVSTLFVRLRQAITSGDFEVATRNSRPAADPIYESITVASRRLVEELERNFRSEYR